MRAACLLLLVLVLPVNGYLEVNDVDQFTLMPPTRISINLGNPYAFWINITAYSFLGERSVFPPNRLHITDATAEGKYFLVAFYARNVSVPPTIGAVVDQYFKELPYTINSNGISDPSWEGTWWDELNDDGNYTAIQPLKVDGNASVDLGLKPGRFSDSALFAIYFEGNSSAEMTVSVVQDHYKYYGIRPKEVSLSSESIFRETAEQMLDVGEMVVELHNISAQGILTILLMSNTDVNDHDNYLDYLNGYSFVENFSTHLPNTSNISTFAKRLDKDHMEIASLVQVTIDGFLPHIFLNTWFIVTKEFVTTYVPYPDLNPEESLVLLFYEGTGKAEFVFESYMVRTGLLFPASFDELPVYSETRSVSLSLAGVFMIPLLLRKRRRLRK
ncbi:MAG: hypothetical protein D6732_13050 [Methanobacteriota archaeon]|nr:MAG: hypothetical protein D6732_13050 [Euryarchaeota archaeon]